jgi:hypothetical protein
MNKSSFDEEYSSDCDSTPKQLSPKSYLHFLDRPTLDACISILCVSLSLVLAGTGDLQTLRRFRCLRYHLDPGQKSQYMTHNGAAHAGAVFGGPIYGQQMVCIIQLQLLQLS